VYFLSIVILLSDKQNYVDQVFVVFIRYCYMFRLSTSSISQHQVSYLMMA